VNYLRRISVKNSKAGWKFAAFDRDKGISSSQTSPLQVESSVYIPVYIPEF